MGRDGREPGAILPGKARQNAAPSPPFGQGVCALAGYAPIGRSRNDRTPHRFILAPPSPPPRDHPPGAVPTVSTTKGHFVWSAPTTDFGLSNLQIPLDRVTLFCYVDDITRTNHAMNDAPNQISKKELLEQTGISYGQLYRWKRKGLIPEAWFVKKSAFTGQETFFPRREILARIEQIKGMKDDLALSDLADLLSPSPLGLQLRLVDLEQKNIVSKVTLDLMIESLSLTDPIGFEAALFGWVVDRLLIDGEIALEEGRLILQTLSTHQNSPLDQGQFLFLRKRGVSFCVVLAGTGSLIPDPEAKIVVRGYFQNLVAEFRITLSGDRK